MADITLSNPTDDGYTEEDSYSKQDTRDYIRAGYSDFLVVEWRGYIEWDISSIPNDATITLVVLKYHGKSNNVDCHIHECKGIRPSTFPEDSLDLYNELGEGTVYADVAGFPVVGTNKQIDLGNDAVTDLQSQLSVGWFAIGTQSDNISGELTSDIYSEDYDPPTPTPTLYVEYDEAAPAEGNLHMMGANF